MTTTSLAEGLSRALFGVRYRRRQSLALSCHFASARSNGVQNASARSQGLDALSCVYAVEGVIETEDNSLKRQGQHLYILSIFIRNHLYLFETICLKK